MLHPSTPSKADDGIEHFKRVLSNKWSINIPPREPNWSPSRNNPNRAEDKISARIQFLYFKGGALTFAIDEFERRAIAIYSEWQYKPRGDPSVLPIREAGKSVLRQNFLRRRDPLEEDEVKLLTESLLLCLDQTTARIIAGERFPHVETRHGQSFQDFLAYSKG